MLWINKADAFPHVIKSRIRIRKNNVGTVRQINDPKPYLYGVWNSPEGLKGMAEVDVSSAGSFPNQAKVNTLFLESQKALCLYFA